MEVKLTKIIVTLVVGFVFFLFLERKDIVNSPSPWWLISQILIIYSIPSVGVILSQIFDPFTGMLVAVIDLLFVFIFFSISQLHYSDFIHSLLQTVTVVAFIAVCFIVLPAYRCPIDGGWFVLGKNATLIHQVDDSFTLCHEHTNAENNTACHNFTGGFHGLFAKTTK